MLRNHALWVVGLSATAIAAALLLFFMFSQTALPSEGLTLHPTQTISFAATTLHVAIADTEASREQGLSGITSLAMDEGMLFIFPKDGMYSFWMKDMLFSIDMLWISFDGLVVSIVPSASPATYPHAFTPSTLARYVLEVPAGFAAEHKIGVGSKLHFSF